jgi:hypothetical protein
MKLSQIAAKPQLITISIDDEETVKDFGEPIEFHTWDRQPLDTFMKLANANQQDQAQMIEIVRGLILDEKGKPIIDGENMLPSGLLIKAIAKIVEKLGK